MNLVTSKGEAKNELLSNKPASGCISTKLLKNNFFHEKLLLLKIVFQKISLRRIILNIFRRKLKKKNCIIKTHLRFFTRTSDCALSLQFQKIYMKFLFSKMHQLNSKSCPEVGCVNEPLRKLCEYTPWYHEVFPQHFIFSVTYKWTK